jgi:two-component system response regulator RegA
MPAHHHEPVLIIDGDAAEAGRLVQEFERAGYRATTSTIADRRIVDFLVPFMPGLIIIDPETILERHRPQDWIVQSLRGRFPAASIVVQTRRYSLADCFRCAQSGAAAYLSKPTSAVEVLAFIHKQLPPPQAGPKNDAPLSLARMEWEHISRVLVACQGNKTRAAALLNIPRFTLQRKLRKNPPALVRAA